MSRPTVSAVVICKDEESHIGECLDSLAWCDERIVVDSGSSDATLEVVKSRGAIALHHDWPGYVAQKNWALDQASSDWVLSLDADERCSDGLRAAIEAALESEPGEAGFAVRRHVHYLGRWIDHGGWFPDWKVRLVRRGHARWSGVDPHDKLTAEGRTARLDGELVHYTYPDFAGHLRTVQRFSDVVADEWQKEGRRFRLWRSVAHPPAKFLECYVWKSGWRDGWPGFVIAVTSAFYVFAKYVKLWERERGLRAEPGTD